MKHKICLHLENSARILQGLIAEQEKIAKLAEEMIACLRRGNKLLICGNGGSASDSQHFAAELVGRLQRDRFPLPAIALTSDIAILTAVGNDYGFEQIFLRQVQALGRPGDILVGLSTSGNSPNVLQAMQAAAEQQIRTLMLSGKGGGEMARRADEAIVIKSDISQYIQEGQLAIIHIWCELIEDAIFPKEG